MNILVILLGCHISHILNNRIDTAIQFVNQLNNTNVSWFLSGGIKYPDTDTITEAEKMATHIKHKNAIEFNGNSWDYIYDIQSTNTAENLIMANNFVMDNEAVNYDDIFIITSQFHYERANKMASQIFSENVKWILGDSALDDSLYWEKIHMTNVDNDIQKARKKIYTIL